MQSTVQTVHTVLVSQNGIGPKVTAFNKEALQSTRTAGCAMHKTGMSMDKKALPCSKQDMLPGSEVAL